MRLFVALELSEEVRRRLVECQRELKKIPEARTVAADNLHLTVKFLGEIPEAEVERVAEEVGLSLASFAPFKMTVRGLGCFPDARNPRVLWAAAEPHNGPARMNRELESRLAPLGVAEEKRFAAHITIARFRAVPNRARLDEIIEHNAEKVFGRVDAHRVVLMRSQLSASGSVYAVVKTFVLQTPGSQPVIASDSEAIQ